MINSYTLISQREARNWRGTRTLLACAFFSWLAHCIPCASVAQACSLHPFADGIDFDHISFTSVYAIALSSFSIGSKW